MTLFGLHLDKPRAGTMHSDRIHRLLGVCHGAGMYRTDKTGLQPRIIPEVRAVGEVIETAQYWKYGLHVEPHHLRKVRGMGPQFAYALNVPRVFVEVDGDTVYVRVPRETTDGPLSFDAAWALAPDLPQGSLLLGQADDSAQAALDMTDPGNVHVGVIGMTGSGKSTLMQTMALSVLMTSGAEVALLDPSRKDRKLWPLSGHPSIWRGGLYSGVADIEQALAAIRQHTGGDLFVFVDEVPGLVRQSGVIADHLLYLTESGRHDNVHLILGAQSVTKHSEIFANVSARLVGRMADAGEAYRAASRNDSGAELLRGGGDFVSCTGRGLRHFQAAMCGPLIEWAHRYPPRDPQPFSVAQPRPPTRKAAPMAVMQSTAPLAVELQGRGVDAIPPAVVRDIMAYRGREKRWPSLHHCQAWLHYRNAKSRRAINLACIRMRLPLEYPDWQEDYKVDSPKLEEGG